MGLSLFLVLGSLIVIFLLGVLLVILGQRTVNRFPKRRRVVAIWSLLLHHQPSPTLLLTCLGLVFNGPTGLE